MNKKVKSLLSIVLCITLVLSNIAFADTTSAQQAKYADIVGNTYETQIREWISNGFIKGYPDGNFKPQNQITRSEFMALVNRAYAFTGTMDIKYSDVNKTDWYYKDAAIATKAGFMQGSNGKLSPQDNISRQEMAVILSRLTKNEKAIADDAIINNFADKSDIPAWSKAAISISMKNKLFDGFVDKAFKPLEKVTRLEAVVALDRAFRSMYKGVYASKGTFGPETGMTTLDGDVVVIAPDVTLRNTTINGNLILRETIGEGNVYLEGVVVKGETIVKGGGANSIVIKNSTIGKVIVIKEGNTVRIVATGSTSIDTVDIRANVKLEEYQLTGTGFNDVLVLDDIPAGANVVFEGNFDDVKIDSANINVAVGSGTIGTLTLDKEAVNTNVTVAQTAKVTTLTLDAAANVTGTGSIGTANINASGTKIEQKPTTVNVPTGVQATVAGTTASTTPAAPAAGGGGGGGTPPPATVSVSAINVTSAANATTVINGATLQMSATVTPANATNQTITWSVATLSGGTATINSSTGLLTATGVGTVTVTATNAASGVTGTKVITITPADTRSAVVKDVTLTVDNGLILGFSIDETIDLAIAGKADVKISYFTKSDTNTLIPISNTLAGNAPLVKDKTWDGYLWGVETGKNYSKGTANTAAYLNEIPANTKLSTMVRAGYHAPATDMDYVSIDWTKPATYVVKIEVKDNAGNASAITEAEVTVVNPNAVVIRDIDDLKEAIKNQANGKTWFIEAGTYDLPRDMTTLRNNDGEVDPAGQSGWYMPITANNLTIIGIGNPIITSSSVIGNGSWASQNLITVWGDNVTLKGLTITPKVETNKTIEVVGDKKFTIENCTFTPNTIAVGAIATKGGSLYFNGNGKKGTKAILVKNNTFNYTSVAFDGVEGSDITITGNTFENIGVYAIGNTYWGDAARKTVQYAEVKVNGNNFNNVTAETKIIAARLNQTFRLDGTNKMNGNLINKDNFRNYINFNNLEYWQECKDNLVIVPGYVFESPYKDIDAYVSNSSQLKTAVDTAKAGDTILVAAGEYNESLEITKPIKLIGAGADKTTLNAKNDTSWYVISLGRAGVYGDDLSGTVIEGFTINAPKADTGDKAPIYLTAHGSDNNKIIIRNNTFAGQPRAATQQGIGILTPYGLNIGNVEITNNSFKTLKYGMYFNSIRDALISENTIDDTKYAGMVIAADNKLYACSNVAITGNTLTNISWKLKSEYNNPMYDSGICIGSNAEGIAVSENSITMLNDKLQKFDSSIEAAVSNAAELEAALGNENIESIFIIGNIAITEKLCINHPVTIDGGGNTITVTSDLGTGNSTKHALGIEANDVTIKNLTINNASKAYGVQAYVAKGITLNNITINNSKGAGLTVNGSSVTANGLNTNLNAWGSVNVDPGDGVKTASIFTLNGGSLTENIQIWSDGKYVSGAATVTVNAAGYNKFRSGEVFIWTNKELKNTAVITKDGITILYPTIEAAIGNAAVGDTVMVYPGLYEENITIDVEELQLKSVAGAAGTTIKGSTINITEDNVVIEGFTIDNNHGERAIAPGSSDGTIIQDNIIISSLRGIQGDYYGRPTNLSIIGNTFKTEYGIAGTEDMTGLVIVENTFMTTVEGIGIGVGMMLVDNPVDYVRYLEEMNDFSTILSGAGIVDYSSSIPRVNCSAGTYWFGIDELELSVPQSGYKIFYTLDGTNPKVDGTRLEYAGPFKIEEDTLLRAVSFKDGVYSDEISNQYIISDIDLKPISLKEGYATRTIEIPGIHLPTEGWNVVVRMGKFIGDEEQWDWSCSNVIVSDNRITATIPAGIPIGGHAFEVKFTKKDDTNWYASSSYYDGFRVLPAIDAFEGDDSFGDAKEISVGSTQTHSIDHKGDTDWIKFTAEAGKTYTIRTSDMLPANFYSMHFDPMDSVIYLYDTDGATLIKFNDDRITHQGPMTDFTVLESEIVWSCDVAGTYYVKAVKWDTPNAEDYGVGKYNIRITVADSVASRMLQSQMSLEIQANDVKEKYQGKEILQPIIKKQTNIK